MVTNDGEKVNEITETKVTSNNNTAVPHAFRRDTGAQPKDKLVWSIKDGEWIVRLKDAEGN